MIILASASPRRQDLLKIITENFQVLPADIDETPDNNIEPEALPELLALKKASHIAQSRCNDTVIGCDTGVFINGKMLGKPTDDEDAFRMLKMLSGKSHKVITGCAIIGKGKTLSFSTVTTVSFFELSDNEIREYIATGEPADKAGAYGIQGKGSLLIRSIQGDYFNVVGLPVSALNKKLNFFGK